MAKTIVISSAKGGVGKSTIFDELIFYYERKGLEVGYHDLDTQGGTIHEDSGSDKGKDVVLVDTPGVLTDELKDYFKAADLVVIPLRPTNRDLLPTIATVDIAKATKTPWVLVVNCFSNRLIERECVEYLRENLSNICDCALPQLVIFEKAAAYECSVYDIDKKSKATEGIETIGDELLERLGL